jgi:hypothetical protein
MTCIVGLTVKGISYLGGDAAGADSNGGDIGVRPHPKVFKKNDYVMGYTTSFRLGDILEFVCPPPEVKLALISLREHLIIHWIPVLRKKLKTEGYLEVDKNKEKGGTFIVAYKGELCTIYDDLQVSTVTATYCSVGSGYKYALGALHATSDMKMKPRTRVLGALSAAAFHNAYVREPFTIMES